MITDPVIEVFKAFKTKSKVLSRVACLRVYKDRMERSDCENFLIWRGEPNREFGIYELGPKGLIKTEQDTKGFPVPPLTKKKADLVMEIPVFRLHLLFKSVALFTGVDFARPSLADQVWEISKTSVRATATDGKRLYRERAPVVADGKLDVRIKVPTIVVSTVGALAKYFGALTAVISIYKEQRMVIAIGEFELNLPCLSTDEYPKVEALLQREMEFRVFNIAGLDNIVRELKDCKDGNFEGVEFYPDRAVLGKGVVKDMAVKEVISKEKNEDGSVKLLTMDGTKFDPCILVLHMQFSGAYKEKPLFGFNINYLADVVKLLRDRATLYYSEKDGYGFWLPGWERWF